MKEGFPLIIAISAEVERDKEKSSALRDPSRHEILHGANNWRRIGRSGLGMRKLTLIYVASCSRKRSKHASHGPLKLDLCLDKERREEKSQDPSLKHLTSGSRFEVKVGS